MAISDDWLRFGLGLLVAGGTSAITSLAVNTTQISGLEKRQDADMAQIREIFRNRDEVDRVTRDSLQERMDRAFTAIDRLNQRMDNKFGAIDRGGYLLAALVEVPKLPSPAPVPKIFDDRLRGMRAKLDALIGQLKAGKLDTEDKRDELYSLELDYEMLKGWQIWCETSLERKARCQQHFKKEE